MSIRTLAAQPQSIRALRRSIVAVGGAGLAAALLSTVGGGLMDAAASAAVSGGGAYGSGASAPAVSGLAATDAVTAVELPEHLDASSLQGAVGQTTSAVTADIAAIAAPTTTVPPAPTTTTTTAPRPVTPPPAPGTVQAVITEVFGAHGNAAIGVARCESGLNPGAISRGGGNWGLFQINKVHAKRVANMGYAWEDLLDARVNAIVAKSIFDESGWRPWACRHAAS